ncbi:MAG: type III pantothenate kinase [Pyrinomonadaceae bacterium]|nr:type III pantothenate kinase [Sphingobacteriaceae bacterium]
MINLVIDIGNTLSKVAVFNNRELVSLEQSVDLTEPYLSKLIKDNKIDNSIISSVKPEIKHLEDCLKAVTKYNHFTAITDSEIINYYKTPNTLGPDRYAAVIGAAANYPDQNCLVLDAGTCITYDFISSEKKYFGGSISPGIQMRFKAMHTFTGKLPLVNADLHNSENYGDDTLSSILTGVQKGVLYEVLGFIEYYNSTWPHLKVILCGGDMNFFDTQLKSSIFAHTLKTEPNLVLIGLNEVIYHTND